MAPLLLLMTLGLDTGVSVAWSAPSQCPDEDAVVTSSEYQDLLGSIGAMNSMSRKGNCWDNAVSKSFLPFSRKSSFTTIIGARPTMSLSR